MKFNIFLLAIISTGCAFNLNCTFRMSAIQLLPSVYSCYKFSVSNVNESETLTAVYGTHMEGKSIDDVGFLWLDNAHDFTIFPRGIENFFHNLVALGVRYGNISSLIGDELMPFGNLTWFVLNNNMVERIPGNFFASTPLVHSVWFNNNNIKHVGDNLLDSLSQLGYASFEVNYCVDKIASTSGEVPFLIEHLRNNCSDIETTSESTSTTIETITTTSTQEPSCDINEIICILEEQNQILLQQNSEIKIQVEALETKNEQIDAKIDALLEKSNQMDEKLKEISQENSQMKIMLNEVFEAIVELSTRPCWV